MTNQTYELKPVKLSLIAESTTNPRGKDFENAAFKDLVSSVKEQGVLVPVILRPIENGKRFEVVAGNRRFRAAKLAGLADIPARVEELDDERAREVQIIENLQREDVHPLDEAAAYLHLVKTTSDIKAVAVKVGKHESYIQGRIMLNHLADEVKKAYREGVINDGHAVEIARLSPGGDQQKAVTHVKERTSWGKVYTVKELREWIEDEFFDELEFQPWLKNAEAMAAVGACKECPKDTNTIFGEAKEGACTTTRCYKRKLKKYLDWMKEKTPGLVLVSTEYSHPAGVLGEYDYKRVAKGSKGAKQALVVAGKGRGRMLHVKVTKLPVNQMTTEEKEKHAEETRKEKEAEEKSRTAELERANRRMENMLKNVTWPLKEKHLEPLFDIMLEHASDLDDIIDRRKLEGKKDEYGNYDDAQKLLEKAFAKMDTRSKLQLIVELGFSSVYGQQQDSLMKKFN